MSFFAKIINISTKERNIKIDPGGGNVTTAKYYLPAGHDSQPLPTDYAVADSTIKTGSTVVFGFIDLINESISENGEWRVYGRDHNGIAINEIYLKKNGDILIKNSEAEILIDQNGKIRGQNQNGYFELKENGEFDVNGTTFAPGGAITASSISIGGIDFSSHVHGGVTTGAGLTGGPQ